MSWSESFDKVIETASQDDRCPAARQPEPDQIWQQPRGGGRLRKQAPELESSQAIQGTLKSNGTPLSSPSETTRTAATGVPSCDSSRIIAKLSISAASAMWLNRDCRVADLLKAGRTDNDSSNQPSQL